MKIMRFVLKKNSLLIAILSSIVGSFGYVILFSRAKSHAHEFSFSQLMFMRSFLALILVTICAFFAAKPGSLRAFLKTDKIQLHITRSISGLITSYLSLAAVSYCSLAEANLFLNTIPFFIPFISFFWKKEKIDPKIWPGILTAFAGVYLILHPASMQHNVGVWYGLLGGAFGALSVVAFRVSCHTEPVIRSLFYHLFVFTFVSGLLCLPEGIPITFQTFTLSCDLGIFGLVALLFTSLSFKYAPINFISPFAYSSVVFGLLIDYFSWGLPPEPVELLGTTLVILGLYIMIYLLKKSKDTTKKIPV